MADELDELLDFLGDKREDVRQQAAEIVQGLTGTDDGVAQLAGRADKVVGKLLHLLGKPAAESKPAATALVNLMARPEVITVAVTKGAVERAMEFLREGECPPDLLIMLLTNLTSTEGGVHVFTQEGKSLEGFFITKMAQLLVEGKPAENYDHAAGMLQNASRHPTGRKVLLDPSRGLLGALLPSLTSPCETRRVAMAGLLRNSCIDAPSRALVLGPDAIKAAAKVREIGEKGMTPAAAEATMAVLVAEAQADGEHAVCRALLRPISGLKPAELSDAVRQSCAEAVAALVEDEGGRAALAACEAPRLLKDGYAAEEDDATCAALETAAGALMQHGLVPNELAKKASGVQRCEVIEDEEGDAVGEGEGGAS